MTGSWKVVNGGARVGDVHAGSKQGKLSFGGGKKSAAAAEEAGDEEEGEGEEGDEEEVRGAGMGTSVAVW